MSHTPEKWHVGYDQEYDIDAGDDGRTIGYPTGRDEFDGTIFTVTGEDQIEIIAEHIRDERTALRITALWNMAERLGLSTEDIESGNVETKLKAAPDMLEALETIMDIGDKACRDIARAAIRKARGGESPMTREAKAIELLHRVLNYFVGEFAFPEKMERLLEEIEVFLTEIEAEERDALRK